MKIIWKIATYVITCAAGMLFGSCAVSGQLLPPPPVTAQPAYSDGFTSLDRARLASMYRMMRAVHTRLFPLQEEQRLLNGSTTIE